MPTDPTLKAGDLLRVVSPTPDREYEGRHATPRDGVLSVLRESQSNRLGEFPVVTGVRGTPIERMQQVLADYLNRHDTLSGCSKVLWVNLDAVRRAAKLPGESSALSTGVLQVALDRARSEQALLVMDHVEVLDADKTLDPNGEIEQGLEAVLSANRDALVVGLYWETRPGVTGRGGILGLANVKRVPLKPYSAERARATIFERFAPQWEKERLCVCELNAFDAVFALEPWILADGEPEALPYLAVFLGKYATQTLAGQGSAQQFQRRAKEAQTVLDDLRRQLLPKPDLMAYFAPILTDIDTDLKKLVANPETKRGTKKVVTRAHISAQLLGGGNHAVVLPQARPATALPYNPDGQAPVVGPGDAPPE